MESMVKMILEVMMTMSVCIVILSCIKKVTKNRYGFNIRYVLWYAIAIRLLLPFNISLPSSFQIEQPNLPTLHISEPSQINVTNIDSSIATKYEVVNSFDENDSIVSAGLNISVTMIGACASLLFTAILLLIQMIKYRKNAMKLKKKCKRPSVELDNLFHQLKVSMGIKKNIPIHIVEGLSSPMLVGVFNPYVVLPNIPLTRAQVEMICMHELMHYKRKDVLFKWILMVVRSLYWFNPIMLLLYNEADKDIELSCDEMILKEKSLEYRKEYGFTILDVLKNQNSSLKMNLTTNFNSNKFVVKERIMGLLNTNVKKLSKNFVLGTLCVVLLSSMLVSCSNSGNKNNVAYRKIDRLETTEGTEYYFTIYNQEFGVKVLKDASFKMSKPEIIQEDGDEYFKGDIAFSFVDKKTGEVLMDLIYSTNLHTGLTVEYEKGKKQLYSFNPLNDDVNQRIQDYVILHDDTYLTNDVINTSLNSCALIREVSEDVVYLELYTQDTLELNQTNVYIDIPEGDLGFSGIPDDRQGSINVAYEQCGTLDVQTSGISTSVYQYNRENEEDILQFIKGTRVQPVGAFGKVYGGFYFDNIVVLDEYLQVKEKISNK